MIPMSGSEGEDSFKIRALLRKLLRSDSDLHFPRAAARIKVRSIKQLTLKSLELRL